MNEKLSKEAKATFQYNIGNGNEHITVGGCSAVGKSQVQWKTDLLIDAGTEVSKNTGISRENIAFVLVDYTEEG